MIPKEKYQLTNSQNRIEGKEHEKQVVSTKQVFVYDFGIIINFNGEY
jgi:hypothetical protein